jgi:hypothetical protein
MEKVKNSKIAHWSSKLAVESEPNLTTAQLMLFNHDLKPVRILHTILLFGSNVLTFSRWSLRDGNGVLGISLASGSPTPSTSTHG